MNKKFKFTSAILTISLLITPISGLINFNNVAKANYKINNKKIKKEITFSDYDFFKEFKKAYENKEINITEEQFKKIEANIQSRGYWGENKIVQFHDEAIDLYLSGVVMDIIKSGGVEVFSELAKRIPYIGEYIDSWLAKTAINSILSKYVDTSNGVIIYFVTYWGPIYFQGAYTGRYGYIKYYSHWRSQ